LIVTRPFAAIASMVAALAPRAAPAVEAPAPAVEGPSITVAILRPASDDPVLVDASARLRLELGAAGLTSALVDGGDSFPARVALVREDGVATIDVLAMPASGAALHRRVGVPRDEGGDDPAVIAVRAAEVVRSIRLEVRRPPRVADAPAPEIERGATPGDEPTVDHPTSRFELGLATLAARPYGAALGFAPSAAVAGAVAPHVSIAATFAGPFFTDRPPTTGGSARTHEEIAGLGLRLETWRSRLNVHGLASVGVHHVNAIYDQRGVPPGPALTLHSLTPRSLYSPAVTLTVGASLRVSTRLGVSAQVAALLLSPALELFANGHSLGTLGGPSLMPILSAWATL
jgi:hypothetical protein